jgi:hypothetical protein
LPLLAHKKAPTFLFFNINFSRCATLINVTATTLIYLKELTYKFIFRDICFVENTLEKYFSLFLVWNKQVNKKIFLNQFLNSVHLEK